MEVNGTAQGEEAAVAMSLSVAVTVISAIGLLLNAYILFVIIITKQVYISIYLLQRLFFSHIKNSLNRALRGVYANATVNATKIHYYFFAYNKNLMPSQFTFTTYSIMNSPD